MAARISSHDAQNVRKSWEAHVVELGACTSSPPRMLEIGEMGARLPAGVDPGIALVAEEGLRAPPARSWTEAAAGARAYPNDGKHYIGRVFHRDKIVCARIGRYRALSFREDKSNMLVASRSSTSSSRSLKSCQRQRRMPSVGRLLARRTSMTVARRCSLSPGRTGFGHFTYAIPGEANDSEPRNAASTISRMANCARMPSACDQPGEPSV